MYTPTKWEQVKHVFRYWLCRHKNVSTRTVKVGNDLKNLTVLDKYRYCNDCKSPLW